MNKIWNLVKHCWRLVFCYAGCCNPIWYDEIGLIGSNWLLFRLFSKNEWSESFWASAKKMQLKSFILEKIINNNIEWYLKMRKLFDFVIKWCIITTVFEWFIFPLSFILISQNFHLALIPLFTRKSECAKLEKAAMSLYFMRDEISKNS